MGIFAPATREKIRSLFTSRRVLFPSVLVVGVASIGLAFAVNNGTQARVTENTDNQEPASQIEAEETVRNDIKNEARTPSAQEADVFDSPDVSNEAETDITINGEQHSLNEDGELHYRSSQDGSSTTDVDISVDQHSSEGSSTNHSETKLNISSSTGDLNFNSSSDDNDNRREDRHRGR